MKEQKNKVMETKDAELDLDQVGGKVAGGSRLVERGELSLAEDELVGWQDQLETAKGQVARVRDVFEQTDERGQMQMLMRTYRVERSAQKAWVSTTALQ